MTRTVRVLAMYSITQCDSPTNARDTLQTSHRASLTNGVEPRVKQNAKQRFK